MRKTFSGQLGILIVIVFFISLLITSIANYLVTYNHTYEAAGVEAVGCANITTGLVNPSDVEAVKSGNDSKLAELEGSLNWTVDHKHIFENQYIIELDGTILAADESLKNQGFQAGDSFYIDEEVINKIQETKQPLYSEIYEYGGMKRLTGYAPIFKDHDPNKEIIALNAIDFNAQIVTDRTWDAVQETILLGLVPIALACFVTIWIIRKRTKPISNLIGYSKKIAEGDLSAEAVHVKNKDEIGDLADTLNLMANNLRELIKQFSSNAEHVANSSNSLMGTADKTNHVTKQIAATMQELASGVDQQVNSVEETSEIVEEMSTGVQQIATNSQNVSATAIETSEKTSEGETRIQTAVDQMKVITDTVESLSGVVKGLGDRSTEINQIIEVITDIAEQTNLLALNASIEAARAGEHGKGFAVVADEVRKLAEQSATSTQQISQLIAAIQSETNQAVQSMETATKEVTEGIDVVNNAGASFTEIRASINEVSDQIQEVSAAVQQMASGADHIVASMKNISKVSESAASSSQEVYSSTEEQLRLMEDVTDSVNQLSKMAEESRKNTHKFKLK
ncbi:methyl-accepting chemotaxis protein [Oceanobacillus limi]|uniref:Methyl-accepting chemotaxis protein n=1 Tax=Oceanobacillus limi TaxID=930131 RepID=A0A1I0F960_9BACI|nr:HAMP domain-containing methyl-accepting chemotaxis protein [Oceanobacillus limi]SET54630.1 methyl-accepting chemotaxis protein [Oceanobacillus limi]